MNRPTEEDVKFAINVILSDKAKYKTSLNYTVNYYKAALEMTGRDLQVQCLYVLNNITGWRHEHAKHIRKTLKEFCK